MASKALPTPEELRQLIDYDPETGAMRWRARQTLRCWNAKFVGKPAMTSVDKDGYLRGRINGRWFYAHRVAWVIYYGKWPENSIDHIDGCPTNNAIANLRDVNQGENRRNCAKSIKNSSGVTGVYWQKASGKWTAQIKVNYRQINLGSFEDKELAVAARRKAERDFGFHPNHGRAVSA